MNEKTNCSQATDAHVTRSTANQQNQENSSLVDGHWEKPLQFGIREHDKEHEKDTDEYDEELADLWRTVDLLDSGSSSSQYHDRANTSDDHFDHHASVELLRLGLQRIEKRLQTLNSQLSVAFSKIEDLLSKNFALRKESEQLKQSNSSLIERVTVLLLEKEQLQLALSTSSIE